MWESGDSLSQPVLEPVKSVAEGFAPQHPSGLVSACVSKLSPSMRWFSVGSRLCVVPLVSQLANSGCVCHLLSEEVWLFCRACHGPLPSDDQPVTKPANLTSDEFSARAPLMSPSMSGVTVLDSQHAFVQVDVLRWKTTMSVSALCERFPVFSVLKTNGVSTFLLVLVLGVVATLCMGCAAPGHPRPDSCIQLSPGAHTVAAAASHACFWPSPFAFLPS